jgi:hypothetical protein
MTIELSVAVDDDPEVTLECWSIRETSSGARFFVGYNPAHANGRVSSQIVSFDPGARTGVTQSGRRYRLVGRAGHDSDAEYVWNWAVSTWKISSWTEVTMVIVPDWRNPLAMSKPGSEDGEPD